MPVPSAALDPDIVVVLIGTNNLAGSSPLDVLLGIAAVLEVTLSICPKAEVVAMGLLPRFDGGLQVEVCIVCTVLQPHLGHINRQPVNPWCVQFEDFRCGSPTHLNRRSTLLVVGRDPS